MLKQLRSGSFDPKKTTCYCLSNVVYNNEINMQECIQMNGVSALVDLINDEDDDILSEKAFECLEMLGPDVLSKLTFKIGTIMEGRKPVMWRRQRTIILDIYQKKERHIYTKKVSK